MQPECWAGLGGLTRLQRLRVGWFQIFTGAQQSALESSLNSLPQLSELSVYLWSHRNVECPPLALRLPALRILSLHSVCLPSLSFLQHSPLLEKLDLAGCVGMSADDTVHSLQTFAQRLRRLRLYFSVRLSAEQEAALRPPSPLLPALTDFIHTKP